MGSSRNIHSQEIAQLQLQLADAALRLDQLEQMSLLRARKMSAGNPEEAGAPAALAEAPELRFAACVASGMTKIRAG